MPERGGHLGCTCVQAGDEGADHLHCGPSHDHDDDLENREGALMARQNLKREGRSWQDGRAPWQGLGTVHGHANPMCRHENHGGRAPVVPCTFILPSLNCEIFWGRHAIFSAANCRRLPLLTRLVTFRLAKARRIATRPSPHGRRTNSRRGTRIFRAKSHRQSGHFMEPVRSAVAI